MDAIKPVGHRRFDVGRSPLNGWQSAVAISGICSQSLGLLCFFVLSVQADEDIRFNEQIRPILAEKCLSCHGPDAQQRQADLRLDDEQAAKEWAIVPHNPDESEFWLRIVTDDSDVVMPPVETGNSLTVDDKELLRRWIEQGAPYQDHWSLEPISKPALPDTNTPVNNEIDRFIVAALEQKQLSLAPKIDRVQLIRRATYDLTGLPPTWDEVQAFLADESPEAYESMIDRLLESPRYGERWGRHWLDLARYADTHGGSAIGFTRFAFSYTYRDYVIAAINADVPYDRFVREQLAADQLGLDENDPALAGLGFLTVGMQYRNRHDLIDDQIDVVTRGLMGLTVACARCHDHKYDAIPTDDYYALYATLAPSESPELLPLVGSPEETPEYRAYQHELEQRQTVVQDMARDQAEVMRSRLRMQVGLYLTELAKGAGEQDLANAILSYRTDDIRPAVLNRWYQYLGQLSPDDPVFGPWHRLNDLDAEGFGVGCQELVAQLNQENGDPASFENQRVLTSNAPRWNPRVLRALESRNPQTLVEVAEAYGQLFATVHEEWLRSVLEATLEAGPAGAVVPDEDPKHEAINSAVNQQLRRHLYGPGTPTVITDDEASHLLNRPVHDNLNGRKGAIHSLHLSSAGSPPRAMTLTEAKQPQDYFVFRRGNPIDRGEPVEARFLTMFAGGSAESYPNGKRRLALAESIVAEDNPLTRRVIVNWVWQHHFGQGIVRTPDDFGIRGAPPTHPQLLDYLAEVFKEDGWSLKELHKRIMMTDAYQQASVEKPEARMIDPHNELLWRFPRQRLDLEAMRDAMLMVSGELDETMGGRPYELDLEPAVPRRTVYAFINRDIISSLESTFDRANPNACTLKRPDTTVPQQTLFALNSAFIQDRARAFAQRAKEAEVEDPAARLQWMYQEAFSRQPSSEEIELGLKYVQQLPSEELDPWQQLAHVLLAANEFVFVD